MGADYLIPSLLPLVIATIVGFMFSWLIGFSILFLSTAVGLFIAGFVNHDPILLYITIIPTILGILCVFESLRRIMFKSRINDYIVEGHNMIANRESNTYDTQVYMTWGNDWNKKVSEDIRHKKGQSEETFFLHEEATKVSISQLVHASNDWEKRLYTAQIVGLRLKRLEDLQKRL